MPIETRPAVRAWRSERADLCQRYEDVRARTDELCATLEPEDCVLQSMTEASPVRWHLAHTTWFFETFVLARGVAGYRPFHPEFERLFNSYYESVGQPLPRERRGLLSRPTVAEVMRYRRHVDERLTRLLEDGSATGLEALLPVIELGVNHEQQHQELILTDLKHALFENPLYPVYRRTEHGSPDGETELGWKDFDEGLVTIGRDGEGFAFDNEGPHHRVLPRRATELADPPGHETASSAEFMADGGYTEPLTSCGSRTAGPPLAAEQRLARRRSTGSGDGTAPGTRSSRSAGLPAGRPTTEPVCHVSFYEADAYARWAGARLPTEFRSGSTAAADRLEVRGQLRRGRAACIRVAPAPAGETGLDSALRRRLGVDVQLRTPPIRASGPAGGRDRGVQREVHVQPVRAARRVVRHPAGPHPPDVPELLPGRRPVAVLGHPARDGRLRRL